jgi:hypothetical protein
MTVEEVKNPIKEQVGMEGKSSENKKALNRKNTKKGK